MNIYFVDDEHRANYEACQAKFKRNDFSKNGEYRATCYIAAMPVIFKCFPLGGQTYGPFDWYADYLSSKEDDFDQGEELAPGNPGALTGQTKALVEMALSLWNGHRCDLSDIASIDPELYLVLLQALDLRRTRPAFDYTQYAVQNMDGWNETILKKQG